MFQIPLENTDPVSPAGQRHLTLREGTRIGGRFRLGQLIERGGELAVFEGLDENTKHEVLVRFRPSASRFDPRLDHPGIAQYVDHGCIGQWYAGVLDPGEGQPLSSVLRTLGSDHVPVEELVMLGVDLLSALDHAHAHGLTHGNLGIHSLHLTPEWGTVVLDFPEDLTMLRDEALPFASPERLNGARGDERSDVYAVAALLYSLGAGEPPFGLSPHQARDGHLYQELPQHPNLPTPLFEALATAMAKNPEHRYPTAAGFSQALLDAFNRYRTPDVVTSEPAPIAIVRGQVESDDERPLQTMDPAPPRKVTPKDDPMAPYRAELEAMDDEGGTSMLLPGMLLAVLCLLVAGLAGGSMLLAGGLWWLTSMGPLSAAGPVVVDSTGDAPVTMPDATEERVEVIADDQAGEIEVGEPLDRNQMLMQRAENAAARQRGELPKSPTEKASPKGTSKATPPAKAGTASTGGFRDGRTSDPGVSATGDMRVPVTFGYDTFEATPESGFDAFMMAANAHEGRVRLTGHTDSLGSAEANRLMGLGRAWSVSLLMAAQGYDDKRIDLLSGGEDYPIADNSTEEGRAQNRRVTAEFAQERRVSDLLIKVE